jgi:hypothetical protein
MPRARLYELVRTHTVTGAVFTDGALRNIRAAEQRVAWCGTDNLALTRPVASSHAVAAGEAFKAGRPFELGPYRFELREL